MAHRGSFLWRQINEDFHILDIYIYICDYVDMRTKPSESQASAEPQLALQSMFSLLEVNTAPAALRKAKQSSRLSNAI